MTTIQGAPRVVRATPTGGELAGSHTPAKGGLRSRVNGELTNAPKVVTARPDLDQLDEMYRERSGYVPEVDWRHHR